MGKVWVLDTETKGTGANVVPLEKTRKAPEVKPTPRGRKRPAASGAPARGAVRTRTRPAERTTTALPPGHVRKKATGELGRVQSIDSRAGTATVLWLRQGRSSTVPLTALSRR